MGLPLFVAPIESDVSHAVRKTGSTSPRRSSAGIRRLHTNSSRPRLPGSRSSGPPDRYERRRTRLLQDALNTDFGASERAAAADYIRNGFMTEHESRQPDLHNSQQRQSRMRNMVTIFGEDWRTRDWEQPQQDLHLNWWIVQPRQLGSPPTLTRLHRPRTGSRSPELESLFSSNRPPSGHLSPLSVPWSAERQTAPRRTATQDLNGLGDRDRSLSPEEWEILFTTLTPDPQPPSASSSFASSAASRSAGVSSNTSLSEQPQSTENPLDAPCESGCENSDDDEPQPPRHSSGAQSGISGASFVTLPTMESLQPSRYNSRRPYPVRFHVPDGEAEHPSESLLPPRTMPSRLGGPRRSHRASSRGPDRGDDARGLLRFETSELRNGWIGQLLVDMSESDGLNLQPRRPQIQTSTARNNGVSAEEELTDMRRIVRSLADREDIPDELWAEAGLSRTLHREANR